MIEINLLTQGHGLLYKQKQIKKNLSYRRAKTFLLLTLLLSTLITSISSRPNLVIPPNFQNFLITSLFKHLEDIWSKNNFSSPAIQQKKGILNYETPIDKKDQGKIKRLNNSTVVLEKQKIQEKEPKKEKAFYVKVASTILSESADVIQKNILLKGFQSTRGIDKIPAKNFFIIIGPEKDPKRVKNIIETIKNSRATWRVEKRGNNSFQISNHSFFFIEEAEKFKKLLLEKGLKVNIIQKKVLTSFHEVRVGKFKKRKNATPLLKQLKKAGIKGIIVER